MHSYYWPYPALCPRIHHRPPRKSAQYLRRHSLSLMRALGRRQRQRVDFADRSACASNRVRMCSTIFSPIFWISIYLHICIHAHLLLYACDAVPQYRSCTSVRMLMTYAHSKTPANPTPHSLTGFEFCMHACPHACMNAYTHSTCGTYIIQTCIHAQHLRNIYYTNMHTRTAPAEHILYLRNIYYTCGTKPR